MQAAAGPTGPVPGVARVVLRLPAGSRAREGEGRVMLSDESMARDELDRGALFVVNHSGGKDSQATGIRVAEMVPQGQLLFAHATLGEHEWEGALEHARDCAAAAGAPFVVAQSVKTFFEMVEHRFKVRPGPNSPCWPSASNRQCTSDLKRGPIEREVRRYAAARGFTRIVSCMGMRAEESPARAKLVAWERNARQWMEPRPLKGGGQRPGRAWHNWLPIHSLSRDEVFATIESAGQRPHWAYAAGNERLSCVFCILGSASDARNGAIHRPDLYSRYVEIEQRTGYTMHQSRRSLPVLTGLTVAQAYEANAKLRGAS